MPAPRLLLMLLYRPVRLMPVVFACGAVLTWLAVNFSRHNPNSHFFAPDESTFVSPYSDIRRAQARKYIADVEQKIARHAASGKPSGENEAPLFPRHRPLAAGKAPELAVVFVTSPRNDREAYADIALGSFLSELTPQEREQMYIAVSEGDRTPQSSPLLEKVCLHALVDEIAIRGSIDSAQIPTVAASNLPTSSLAKMSDYPLPRFSTQGMPTKVTPWHTSVSIDYSVALQICIDIGAPHCLVLEDDVVFASAWYKTFTKAVRQADKRYGEASSGKRWGYLRLFYAEKYFGWENDEVAKLVIGIVGVVTSVVLFLIVFVRFPVGQVALVRESRPADYPTFASGKARQSPRPSYVDVHKNMDEYNGNFDQSHEFSLSVSSDYDEDTYKDHAGGDGSSPPRLLLPIGTVFLLGFLALYSSILLILSGRNLLYWVPQGVSEMPSRGCCAQAIVYPLRVIPDLMEYVRFWHLERPHDINTNRFIESHELVKLAIHPPLVQHIGAGSTRQLVDHSYERATPLWSFAFEKLHALRKTH